MLVDLERRSLDASWSFCFDPKVLSSLRSKRARRGARWSPGPCAQPQPGVLCTLSLSRVNPGIKEMYCPSRCVTVAGCLQRGAWVSSEHHHSSSSSTSGSYCTGACVIHAHADPVLVRAGCLCMSVCLCVGEVALHVHAPPFLGGLTKPKATM